MLLTILTTFSFVPTRAGVFPVVAEQLEHGFGAGDVRHLAAGDQDQLAGARLVGAAADRTIDHRDAARDGRFGDVPHGLRVDGAEFDAQRA